MCPDWVNLFHVDELKSTPKQARLKAAHKGWLRQILTRGNFKPNEKKFVF
jgi:hypothetical protein